MSCEREGNHKGAEEIVKVLIEVNDGYCERDQGMISHLGKRPIILRPAQYSQ